MPRRRIALTFSILLCLVVLIVIARNSLSMAQRPMYQPGELRAEEIRDSFESVVSKDTDEAHWQVEQDVKLFRKSSGTGAATILYLHDGPGYPPTEIPVGLRQLYESHTIHVFHQRGCGLSTRPFDKLEVGSHRERMRKLEARLGIGAQLTDIERIRLTLGEERLILVGHGFGGFLATLYAIEFPTQVEALVLVGPAGLLYRPRAEMELKSIITKNLPESDRKGFARLSEEDFDFQSLREMNEKSLIQRNREFRDYFERASGFEKRKEAEEPGFEVGGWVRPATRLSLGQNHDYRRWMNRIEAPTLVLHDATSILPSSISQEYAELIPNAEYTLFYPEAATSRGAFLLEQDRKDVPQVLGEFLERKTQRRTELE